MKFLYKLIAILLLIGIGFSSGLIASVFGKTITAYTEIFLSIIVVAILTWSGLGLIFNKNE